MDELQHGGFQKIIMDELQLLYESVVVIVLMVLHKSLSATHRVILTETALQNVRLNTYIPTHKILSTLLCIIIIVPSLFCDYCLH